MVWNGMSSRTTSNGNRASFDTDGTYTTSRNGNHASDGLQDLVRRSAQESDEFACVAASWYRPTPRRPSCSWVARKLARRPRGSSFRRRERLAAAASNGYGARMLAAQLLGRPPYWGHALVPRVHAAQRVGAEGMVGHVAPHP